MKLIENNGLPLKIRTEWTEDIYQNDFGQLVRVEGWLIRINNKKYPRGHVDGDGSADWTYRYTSPKNLYGKCVAIKRALLDARMQVDKRQFNGFFSKLVNQE